MKNEKYNRYLEIMYSLVDGKKLPSELEVEKSTLHFKSVELALSDFLKVENYKKFLNIEHPIIIRSEEDFNIEYDRYTSLYSINTDTIVILNRIKSRLELLDFKIVESSFGKWSFSAENSRYKLKLNLYVVNNTLYLASNKVISENCRVTETNIYDIVDKKIREKVSEDIKVPYNQIII